MFTTFDWKKREWKVLQKMDNGIYCPNIESLRKWRQLWAEQSLKMTDIWKVSERCYLIRSD